jgi:DNA-directed RNA polymerase delta subunit
MGSKAIKVKEENYKWLLEVASDIQKKEGRPVSFDEALTEIKKRSKKRKNG